MDRKKHKNIIVDRWVHRSPHKYIIRAYFDIDTHFISHMCIFWFLLYMFVYILIRSQEIITMDRIGILARDDGPKIFLLKGKIKRQTMMLIFLYNMDSNLRQQLLWQRTLSWLMAHSLRQARSLSRDTFICQSLGTTLSGTSFSYWTALVCTSLSLIY